MFNFAQDRQVFQSSNFMRDDQCDMDVSMDHMSVNDGIDDPPLQPLDENEAADAVNNEDANNDDAEMTGDADEEGDENQTMEELMGFTIEERAYISGSRADIEHKLRDVVYPRVEIMVQFMFSIQVLFI